MYFCQISIKKNKQWDQPWAECGCMRTILTTTFKCCQSTAQEFVFCSYPLLDLASCHPTHTNTHTPTHTSIVSYCLLMLKPAPGIAASPWLRLQHFMNLASSLTHTHTQRQSQHCSLLSRLILAASYLEKVPGLGTYTHSDLLFPLNKSPAAQPENQLFSTRRMMESLKSDSPLWSAERGS